MENKKFHDKFGQEFKTGDIIEFKSPYYSHWGVYLGNGMFIDSRPSRKTSLYNKLLRRRWVQVMKRKLDLGEEKVVMLRNNFMDNIYEPRTPDEIVKTAGAFDDFFMPNKQDFVNQAYDSKQFALFLRYKNLPKSESTFEERVISSVIAGMASYALSTVVLRILHL